VPANTIANFAMAKTQPVPCVVRENGIAEDDSLAENDERVGLHPLDQFRAFQTLRDGGLTEEDIAARHFVTTAIVKQRLRLASVSPKLHEVYAEDGMALEQLMAFSVAADHARQEQVWENVSRSGYDEPYRTRRSLTEDTVRASDRRARFVGLGAYEQAGGGVLRDLFEHDDGGWLQDVSLLDRLVTEKLKAEAETIATEGWKWISVAVDFPHGHSDGLRELEGKPADLTGDEQATIDALNAEHAKLEFDHQDADELPDEVDQRLGEIEAARVPFEERSVVYDPAEIARAGVFVSIDSKGRLSVDLGYVRPEDKAPVPDPETEQGADTSSTGVEEVTAPVHGAVISVAGAPVEAEDDDEDVTTPSPDRLITELSTSHAGFAGCAGGKPRHHIPSSAAKPRAGDLLPVRCLGELPGDRTSHTDLSRPSSRFEGKRIRQSYRHAARTLEGTAAEERGGPLGRTHCI
jgi:ParB family chromosome partitioning protein